MRARPISCAAVNSVGQVKRKVFCAKYDACLDKAIQKNWQGFSCERCGAFEREQWDREQWADDYVSCVALLYFVTFAKLKLQVCRSNPSFGRKRRFATGTDGIPA